MADVELGPAERLSALVSAAATAGALAAVVRGAADSIRRQRLSSDLRPGWSAKVLMDDCWEGYRSMGRVSEDLKAIERLLRSVSWEAMNARMDFSRAAAPPKATP